MKPDTPKVEPLNRSNMCTGTLRPIPPKKDCTGVGLGIIRESNNSRDKTDSQAAYIRLE
jgi:hypothetical protein